MRRITGLATTLAIVAAMFVTAQAPAGAQTLIPSDPVPWCSAGPAPCIESATRNGAAVTSTDPNWRVLGSAFTLPGGTRRMSWNVESTGTGLELGAPALADVWTITFDVGTLNPRIAFVRGRPGSVVRDATAGTLTVTASPVQQTTDDCSSDTGTVVCTAVPGREWEAYLGGDLSDAGAWADPVQRASFDGTDIFTDVSYLSELPTIVNDPTTGEPLVRLELGNSRYRLDGVTVFRGFIRHVVPAGFLSTVYGIDDPASLRSAGIVTGFTGPGAGTLSVTSSPAGIVIEGSNITFSARTLEIRAGRVTPLRPQNVRTPRTFDRRVRVVFAPASARGSAVDAHVIRCRERNGDDVERARTTGRRAVVRGLEPGRVYICRVRALSDAGPGRWSRPVRIPANR
ncbi:MAG: fibronectin type III domain-containing protein [Acidimicrobiales bacterium]